MAQKPAGQSDRDQQQTGVSHWPLLFKPGLGLKRWLGLTAVGFVLFGLGLDIFLRAIITLNSHRPPIYWLALEFLPDWQRGLVFLAAGASITVLGLFKFQRIISFHLSPILPTPENRSIMQTLMQRYQRRSGPKIVAIGGGTGMPQLLRGLRRYTENITAIVTVADDGGSSGRLRRQMGTLPPGDFRNNIAALSEAEGLMTRLFQYRFAESDVAGAGEVSELAGHSFGNLFITTMAAVTGSFETGIAESSNVLRVRGRVLPSTLDNVVLCAEVRRTRADGHEEWIIVEGESKLPKTDGRIERVYLKPEQARGYPEAIRAILQADMIVAGPGSFFTSVMPNLLVESVRDAIMAAAAPRIYVCNVATQTGETDRFTVSDHMQRMRDIAGPVFTSVLANDNYTIDHPPSVNSQWVTLPAPGEAIDYCLYSGDIVDEQRPWRHDSAKLAARLMEIYQELRAQQASGRPSTSKRNQP